jgi:hypothetical protein
MWFLRNSDLLLSHLRFSTQDNEPTRGGDWLVSCPCQRSGWSGHTSKLVPLSRSGSQPHHGVSATACLPYLAWAKVNPLLDSSARCRMEFSDSTEINPKPKPASAKGIDRAEPTFRFRSSCPSAPVRFHSYDSGRLFSSPCRAGNLWANAC